MSKNKSKIIEFVLEILGYSISFYLVSKMFKSFCINSEYQYLYSLLAAVLIFVLNKTVRKILFFITIPITAISLGAFYFVINTLMLKLTDWIMGAKLDFTNIWILFFISIIISAISLLIDLIIIKPVIKRMR